MYYIQGNFQSFFILSAIIIVNRTFSSLITYETACNAANKSSDNRAGESSNSPEPNTKSKTN